MQNGQIVRRGPSWLLRYWRDQVGEDGKVERRRVQVKLAPVCDQYRGQNKALRQLAEEILSPINAGRAQPMSIQTLGQFIESSYLPMVRRNRRPSTIKGYEDIYRNHIKNRVAEMRLRDFNAADGQEFLSAIARETGLNKTSLKHIKHFLSGVFSYAILKELRESNPMQAVRLVDIKASTGNENKMCGYTLAEVSRMLPLLREPARTAVIVAAFTGLNVAELRGLKWEDITNENGTDVIRVTRNYWRTHETEPKTEFRKAPVELLPSVAKVLAEHRKRNPATVWIFQGPSGKPLDLSTFGSKLIKPALESNGVTWYGWHAFRRGLGTTLAKTENAVVVQKILRHSNVQTTLKHYVKPSTGDVSEAMKRFGTSASSEALLESFWNRFSTKTQTGGSGTSIKIDDLHSEGWVSG